MRPTTSKRFAATALCCLFVAGNALAAPPEGKGKPDNPGQGQNKGNGKGNGNGNGHTPPASPAAVSAATPEATPSEWAPPAWPPPADATGATPPEGTSEPTP